MVIGGSYRLSWQLVLRQFEPHLDRPKQPD